VFKHYHRNNDDDDTLLIDNKTWPCFCNQKASNCCWSHISQYQTWSTNLHPLSNMT